MSAPNSRSYGAFVSQPCLCRAVQKVADLHEPESVGLRDVAAGLDAVEATLFYRHHDPAQLGRVSCAEIALDTVDAG